MYPVGIGIPRKGNTGQAGFDAAPEIPDAYFAQRYCRKWKLPHDGIRVELEPTYGAQHMLTDLKLKVVVPPDFPEEHVAGLLRNAGACPVKKTLEAPPMMAMELIRAGQSIFGAVH